MTAPRQPLTPIEQNELLQDITARLLQVLPPGWHQLIIEYQVIGAHIDVAVGVRSPDGVLQLWNPPAEVWRLFARLRKGMYRDGVGTWFAARFSIDPPDTFSINYNWQNEPAWGSPPPSEAYPVELSRFPRTEDNIPPWFRTHLAGTTDAAGI